VACVRQESLALVAVLSWVALVLARCSGAAERGVDLAVRVTAGVSASGDCHPLGFGFASTSRFLLFASLFQLRIRAGRFWPMNRRRRLLRMFLPFSRDTFENSVAPDWLIADRGYLQLDLGLSMQFWCFLVPNS
jgi:hypothetical protein